tara:strand:+ start:1398 stop:1634 length:237 start_codon:yes stop_codon:yes gene_type:complete
MNINEEKTLSKSKPEVSLVLYNDRVIRCSGEALAKSFIKNHYVSICDIECNDKNVEMYLLSLLANAYNDFLNSEGELI